MKKTLLLAFMSLSVAVSGSCLFVGAKEIVPGRISSTSLSYKGEHSALNSGESVSRFNDEGQLHQLPVSAVWEKQNSPVKSPGFGDIGFTYKIVAPEGQNDFKLTAVGMYNSDWNFLMSQYRPMEGTESVYPEKLIEAPETLSDGTYELLAWGIVQTGEFSYVGYCTHATVDLTENGQIVTADFSECKNRLRLNCNQGNGDPFPQFDPDAEGELRSLLFVGRFAYGNAYYDYGIQGTVDFEMLVSDFPEADTSFYQASFDYLDFGTMSGTTSGAGIRSPFVEDFEGTIQQKYMKYLTNKTSLSPNDKAMTVKSMASGSLTLDVTDFGNGFFSVENGWTAFCSWVDGTPASEMSVYKDMGLNHQPGFNWEDCGFTGFRAYSDDEYVYKYSGPVTYFDNKPVLVGWQDNLVNGDFTFLYPKDVFNIDVENQNAIYFLNPLYAKCEPNVYKDWEGEDKISFAFLSEPAYYGVFHEKLSVPEEIVIKNIYYDDEEIEDFNALQDKPFEGHSVKVCMEYPDGWVQDKYPAKFRNETVIHLSSESGADSRAPYLSNFQVCDSEGKITGFLGHGGSGKIYLGIRDMTSDGSMAKDTQVTVKAAPRETDNWIELTMDSSESLFGNAGMFFEYSLNAADFSEDVWYDVLIEALDSSGNSMSQILECSFSFSDGAGVEGIKADDSSRTRYYNMQGIEIPSPEPGLNIVVKGNRVSKTVVL